MAQETHSLFFYGTLMVPAVLARVIGRSDASLLTRDAILPSHTRHHVKHADYPAVVSAKQGTAILGPGDPLWTEDDLSVRGSLVSGLSKEDVAFLDEFEGDEYVREAVTVSLISSGETLPAQVYIWSAPLSRLEPSLWSFADFMRDKAHRWVGTGANAEYVEVDRRRAMAGVITPTEPDAEVPKEEEELPAFGKAFREKYWTFEDGWVNVNHGSYGAAPIPVIKAFRDIQDRSAASPDRFIRTEYMDELADLRARLAQLIKCDTDDLVLVPNATSGVNTILRSLTSTWQEGDKFLYFSSTIYDACHASLRYIVDTHPHLKLGLVPVPVVYPISHAALLEATQKAIENEEAKGGKIRLALVDAISSNPGVIVPWVEVTKLLKQHQIISLIDAAHEIGQLPVDLASSQPDFWVSNCHKWLMAHRSCAVLYVSRPYQHLMHSIPTGHSYAPRTLSSKPGEWVSEFEWNGTIDYSPVLSTAIALDFRAFCGGEARINKYCHELAMQAGALVAKELGTETMGAEELVANMINVRLPIAFVDETEDKKSRRKFIMEVQITEYRTIAPPFTHNGAWWVRLSAQVYNDLEDYVYIAKVLKEVSARVEKGEYLESSGK